MGSIVRVGLLLSVLLPALIFLAVALQRQLNFDEPLALRSGWLLIEGTPGFPAFCMPLTLALGWVGHQIADPGLLFLLLRAAVAISVLTALAWMLRRARADLRIAGLTLALCLLHGSFGTYAYEFRYDWAILLGWLAAFGLIQRESKWDVLALGVCVSWLAAHHLKGVFFAAFLYFFFLLSRFLAQRGGATREASLRTLLWFHLGILVSAVVWLGICLATGTLDDAVALYRGFVTVASGEPKLWPWQALGVTFTKDAIWWISAFLALALSARDLLRALRSGRDLRDPRTWGILFAGVPLLFLFIHPHPWAYMLAVPAPFLAYLMARVLLSRLRHGSPRRRASIVGVLGGALLLFYLGTGLWPGLHYVAALQVPMTQQVETLRALREFAAPEERIIDPSGLAYFQAPCVKEWYLDALFGNLAAQGVWMQELWERTPAECPLALNSYRLFMLPPPLVERIHSNYQLLPSGVALVVGDPRIPLLLGDGTAALPTELKSFWW